MTVLAKLVPLFFWKCTCTFFFHTRSLTDRSQIVTDTCKNYVPNFIGRLLNHLYYYANENVSVKHLSLICITSILTTIYSLKNCSVYGGSCLNYSCKSLGSFGKNFVKFIEKKWKCYSPALVGPYWKKLCPLSWVRYSRPRAEFFQHGPSGWRTHTYINIYIVSLLGTG